MASTLSRVKPAILFFACSVSIFVIPLFIHNDARTLYIGFVPILYLLSTAFLRVQDRFRKYFHVFLAFSAASTAFALDYFVVGAIWPRYREGILPPTVEDIVCQKLLSTLVVIAPIALFTKIAGQDVSSIFLQRGRLLIGVAVGLVTLFIFALSSVPLAQLLFNARSQRLTPSNLMVWIPWVTAFVLANGLREELWFRGLFLKKYESFIGADGANLLQAMIFPLAHLASGYTSSLLIFTVIVFFLGLAFGALMQKTDSIIGSILFHAGTDIPAALGYFSNLF